jgi:phosphopantetheinyl transferase (holo-ACP synthase)
VLIAAVKNRDRFSCRHPGESRGPITRFAGFKELDYGFRRNDGTAWLESDNTFGSGLNRRNCGYTVLYCCTSSSDFMERRLSRERLKEELAYELLGAFAAESEDFRRLAESRTAIRIVSDGLGRPELYIGEDKGPEISFSYTDGMVWAALCSAAAGLGIDAADPSEFGGGYPFHRAFQKDELNMALEMCHGNVEEAAAFLWSAKEALLKAFGCGFHLLDPLEVLICGTVTMQEGVECSVRLTEETGNGVAEPHGGGFRVSVARHGKTWVAIAATSKRASAVVQELLDSRQEFVRL